MTQALTGGLGSGGPDAEHAQAGWLVPAWKRRGGHGWSETRSGVAPTLEAHGGTHQGASDRIPLVSGTVSAKWAKGTGGPAGDEAQNLVPVAFTSKDGGQDAGGVAPTLRAMTHRDSHANGGGQVAVAFSLRGRDEGNVPEVHGDGSTAGTLRGASGGSTRDLAAVPIQDGRGMAKGQNGLGVAGEGDPAYTLDSTGAQAVAAPIGFNWQNWTNDGLAPTIDGVGPLDRSQVKAVAFRKVRRASSPEDAESWAEAERANTLNGFDTGDARTTHAVVEPAHPLDLTCAGSSQGAGVGTKGSGVGVDGDPAYAVRAAPAARPAVGTEYAVRRLTPRECERLQGFPDDWTRYDAAGGEIANTHRYRMMGNAVTVNVVAWLAARLRAVAYPD